MKRNLPTILGNAVKEILDKFTPKDVQTMRRILNRVDNITADLEIVMQDIKPAMAELRQLAQGVQPIINRSDSLLKDIDNLAQTLRDLPEENKDEIIKILENMTETTAQIQKVTGRLHAFTAMVEEKYPEFDYEKIGQIVRQLLQKEGVKVNLETVSLWK